MSKPMFKSSLVSAFTKALGEKEEQEEKTQVIDYDFTGKRVLLAEDNQINTEVAVMLLESKALRWIPRRTDCGLWKCSASPRKAIIMLSSWISACL